MSEIMQAPRYYRIDDRMLEPRFFSGQKPEAPIDDHGKFCGQTILDDDAPPAGTVMRFAWHRFDGEINASGSIVVLSDFRKVAGAAGAGGVGSGAMARSRRPRDRGERGT